MKISNYKGDVHDIDVITISIVENYSGHFILFRCSICGNPVFEFRGRVVSELPGGAPVEIPIVVQCQHSNCKQRYLISTILSR